jgi:hypothetical protein
LQVLVLPLRIVRLERDSQAFWESRLATDRRRLPAHLADAELSSFVNYANRK